MREGGDTIWNTLKGCEKENGRGETKIFKKEWGKLGQVVGALKIGEMEPPTNYVWIDFNKFVDLIFWNNSKIALYYTIKLGQIIYNK